MTLDFAGETLPWVDRDSFPQEANRRVAAGTMTADELTHLMHWRQDGYVAFQNAIDHQLRDELLDREIFYTLTEAKILIERWRRQYNTVRPHSALGYRPPAPAAISPAPLSGMIMSPALS